MQNPTIIELQPPYYVAVFTSLRTEGDHGYAAMARRMEMLALAQPGFLGIDSVREGALGITTSYWADEASIEAWKQHFEHREAQRLGRERWYASFSIRIARVERAYAFIGP